MQELLELRDGEGTVAARRHVDECERCCEELERTHQRVAALKALPSLSPPRDRWHVTRDLIVAERRQTGWIRSGWVSLAAAAVLLFIVGTDGVFPVGADSEDVPATAELEALVQQAEGLEQALGTVVSQMRVVNGLTALAIADLEDRLAVLDSRLATTGRVTLTQGELTELWRERVVLMDALVNTHVRQVSSVGF
jgi:hypothetical protein